MNKIIYDKLSKAGVMLFKITTAKLDITHDGVKPTVTDEKYDFTINDYDLPKIIKIFTKSELSELFDNRKNSNDTIAINSYSKNSCGNYIYLTRDEFMRGDFNSIEKTKEKATNEINKYIKQIPELELFCKNNPRKRKEKTQLKEINQKVSRWRDILFNCEAM